MNTAAEGSPQDATEADELIGVAAVWLRDTCRPLVGRHDDATRLYSTAAVAASYRGPRGKILPVSRSLLQRVLAAVE
jgi:hypothetical protein